MPTLAGAAIPILNHWKATDVLNLHVTTLVPNHLFLLRFHTWRYWQYQSKAMEKTACQFLRQLLNAMSLVIIWCQFQRQETGSFGQPW